MMCESIIYNIDEIKELASTIKTTNKLQIAVGLYLECEFIFIAMRAIAIFTNKIILPYLNMVAKCNQLEYSEKILNIYEGE